jgi:hypothetical protein
MTFNSKAYMESGNGVFGLQFLAFVPAGAAAAVARRNRTAIFALVFGLIYVVVTSLNTQYIRYLYPVYPLFMIVCAEAFGYVEALGRAPRAAMLAVGLALASVNFALTPAGGWILAGFRLDAVLSQTSRDALLKDQVPQRQMIAIVNALAGPGARLAIFGPPVAAGLQGTAIFASWYTEQFAIQISRANSPDEVGRIFSAYGVTHAMVTFNDSDLTQVRSREIFNKYGRKLASHENVILYEIDPALIYLKDLIRNGAFKRGMDGWVLEPTAEIPVEPANGLRVLPGSILRQNLASAVRGGETYRYAVDVVCPKPGATLGIQLNWASNDGIFLGATSDTPSCKAEGRTLLHGLIQAPTLATHAQFIIRPVGATSVEIRGLSFFQREFPQ